MIEYSNLMSVQKEALKRSEKHDRYGYFLEQGLGKTALSLYEHYNRHSGRMIIFCPNSLISNWSDEIKKWIGDVKISVCPLNKKSDAQYIIYNYESIIATAGESIPYYVDGAYVVFDESVAIKNFKSARWEAMKEWRELPGVVRLLSGRPIVQSAMDMWTQLRILKAKHVQSNPYAFRNRYCKMGGYMGKQVVGTMNEKHLGAIMSEVSWQAKKIDWLEDCPEKLFTHKTYEMLPSQKRHYIDMFDHMVMEISEDETVSVEQAAHKYGKLQQISSGFVYDEFGEGKELMTPKKNPKLMALKETLEGIQTKVIIFAFFKPTVYMLQNAIGGPSIVGGMSPDEIKRNKDAFNTEDSVQTIICQVDSGKYGHTLLGTEKRPCFTTVFFENNYSLDARIQSEDRNHRKGQENNHVLYIDLFGSPIEQHVINILQGKNDMSNYIMSLSRGDVS